MPFSQVVSFLFFLLAVIPPSRPVTILLRNRRLVSNWPTPHFVPGSIMQTCTDIPPGSCCRIVAPRARGPPPFNRIYTATFTDLQGLDIAAMWALAKAPNQSLSGTVVNGGCTGRVIATHSGGGEWTFEVEMLYQQGNMAHGVVEVLGSEIRVLVDRMEGASYVRLSESQGHNFSGAQGLKPFLGGGRQRFAPTEGGSGTSFVNADSVGSVHHPRDLNRLDVMDTGYALQRRGLEKRIAQTWMWPDRITVGNTTYLQKGGEQSLNYENEIMGRLDMETL